MCVSFQATVAGQHVHRKRCCAANDAYRLQCYIRSGKNIVIMPRLNVYLQRCCFICKIVLSRNVTVLTHFIHGVNSYTPFSMEVSRCPRRQLWHCRPVHWHCMVWRLCISISWINAMDERNEQSYLTFILFPFGSRCNLCAACFQISHSHKFTNVFI